jgi:hypothetical protein
MSIDVIFVEFQKDLVVLEGNPEFSAFEVVVSDGPKLLSNRPTAEFPVT